ncbi:MAG TPA: phosphatidylserine decarboxylase family protein [Pyrinomonadaceae bacterium]|nr:phosphatidylserine decarboxylase family protein [Pyrinomonadaceae bacterium]
MSIVREGFPFIVVPAALSGVAALLGFWYVGFWYVSLVLLVLTAFMAYFFRDPQRITPDDPNLVVAPADGKVTRVKPVADGADSPTVVSIFLSPLDVHINRAPIQGKITDMVYSRGKFLMATNEMASLVNEQNALTIEGEKITVVCKQIAGILARRIVCWKKPGETVALGERFGMIKFSSRTDVLLPPNVQVTVTEGTRVRGGTTVIGRIL